MIDKTFYRYGLLSKWCRYRTEEDFNNARRMGAELGDTELAFFVNKEVLNKTDIVIDLELLLKK